jgi:hypothetical protein
MRIEKRDTPLPIEMQGRWIIDDDPGSILIVDGGEVTCFGSVINYDYKEITVIEDALTVNLRVDDEAAEYDFNRANVVGFVITPDGEFLGYNTKSGVSFTRAP